MSISAPSLTPAETVEPTFNPTEDASQTFNPTDDPINIIQESFPFLGETFKELFPGMTSMEFLLLNISGWTGQLTDTVYIDSLPDPLTFKRIIQNPESNARVDLKMAMAKEPKSWDSFMEDQKFESTAAEVTIMSPIGRR